MPNACEYCHYTEVVDDFRLIHQGRYWQVALSANQEYLGRVFVALLRHAEGLRDLSNEEAAELFQFMKRYEVVMEAAFQPTHFNWSCLMNDAAGSHKPLHVHWHGIPRYDQPREFGGRTFTDSRWPKTSRDITPNMPSPELLASIKETISPGFA